MKYLYLLQLAFIFSLNQYASAQNKGFTLLQQFPEAGQKVTLIYRPDTLQKKNMPPNILVRFSGLPTRNEISYQLVPYQNYWRCRFTIPPHTLALKVSLWNGTDDMNDWRIAYQSIIYQNKKPVEFAYAQMARDLLYAMLENTDIGNDDGKIIDWYVNELALYPKKDFNTPAGRIATVTDSVVLIKKIEKLRKSGSENLMMMAKGLLSSRRWIEIELLTLEIRQKFPTGEMNRFALLREYDNELDLAKKETILSKYVKLFPQDSVETKRYRRTSTAMALLKKFDMKNYEAQLKLAGPNQYLPEQFFWVTSEWANMGVHLDTAKDLTKHALKLLTYSIDTATVAKNKAYNLKIYNNLQHTLSTIALKQNKPKEALEYLSKVTHNTQIENFNYNFQYLKILLAMGQKAEALAVADRECIGWQWDQHLYPLLKPAYLQVRGSEAKLSADSVALMDSLNRNWQLTTRKTEIAQVKKRLVATMINRTAPDFKLRDLNGNMISLKNFKGKTVIILFGASWCDLSFDPGKNIQHWLNKNNKDVVFLFIDTYNTGDTNLNNIKAIAHRLKINNPILIDDKTSSTARAYHAEGLPAMFVINKNGRIRFQVNNNTADYFYGDHEVTARVELAQQ